MLLWWLGVPAAGLLAVLMVPIRIEVDACLDPDAPPPAIRARLRWLWWSWLSGESGQAPPAPRPPAPRVASRQRIRPGALAAALRTPGFPGRCAQLVRQLVRVLEPRQAVVRARIGLDDPCETGKLAGLVAACAPLPRFRNVDLAIVPDFSGAVVVVRAHATWSLRPGVVLWPVARFAAAPVVWRAARAAWRARA